MTNSANPQLDELIRTLKERAKELNCLYVIEEILDNPDKDMSLMFCKICEAIPPGWQYPDICRAIITYNGERHQCDDFELTEWVQHANIVMHDETVGKISVYYLEDRPVADEGPFLKEERKLIGTIASRLGIFLLHNRLKKVFEDGKTNANSSRASWWVILDLLRRTDPRLLMRITRKMTNYMGWQGVEEAEQLLSHFGGSTGESTADDDPNRPHEKKSLQGYGICEQVFEVASNNLNEAEIYSNIHKWIQEDKTGFLVNILENSGSTLAEIADALERFVHMGTGESELPLSREKGFRVSLIRRLLTDQTDFIKIAKHFVQTSDFYELLNRVIYPAGSHGKLGGKGSGLLLAGQILKKFAKDQPEFENIKIPNTWYLTSDTILSFMNYNNLEEIVEQKYKEIGMVRLEYPFIVQLFKNSQFPPEIVHGLSMALEDLGETPLIVRSSSLLEDRMGTAFAGKYKSLFIANQGTKEERLAALLDAIAEVYASTFSPDPIEYRMERELLDYHEEMGILIQEVVGQKIGPYYLPSFSGVGFSRNEYRWSSRIKRDDGVVRIVPGLGTRAVDRLSDDYPIMLAPGQPGLRVNVSLDEKIRYSPKKVDVIHLEHNQFETVELSQLLREYGEEYPAIDRIVSIMRNERMVLSSALGIDFKKDHSVVTFDGLIERTGFISQIHSVLKTLESTLETPIDIEFASDGKDLYLLQCRAQSYTLESTPASIPVETPPEKTIFTAKRFISNGTIVNNTHIVYVDPAGYSSLKNRADLLAVGRAVGKLNQMLPKRQFVLMGPGRWGSRGDITLGVSVTYSDINNASMLIEIARQKGNYVPDLSFGTHFFQDLVESYIRYLPLYPDEDGNIFNETFLKNADNILSDLLKDFDHLTDVVKVIDIPQVSNGMNLHVLMNGDYNKAIGLLDVPVIVPEMKDERFKKPQTKSQPEEFWRWRQRMAEQIAKEMDAEAFGVAGLYLFGSVKNATAGPESDIDLLVHFRGTPRQRHILTAWLQGWSLCLAEMNFLRTGRKSDGLLDVHIVTDQDIEKRTSWAIKINAVTDAAMPLKLNP